MKTLRDLKQYRDERKNIKSLLSDENRNFW